MKKHKQPNFQIDGAVWGEFPISERSIKGRQNYVYMLFDVNENLLYIGATWDLRTRVMAHWHNKIGIHYYLGFPYDDRKKAFATEIELINKYNPPLNKKRDYDVMNANRI